MHRLGLNLYAGRIPTNGNPPTIERYSSIAATSSKGMELVFFPVLIAALIVLNTMLGSVFERVREIQVFSSIGLAPAHIGMLFMFAFHHANRPHCLAAHTLFNHREEDLLFFHHMAGKFFVQHDARPVAPEVEIRLPVAQFGNIHTRQSHGDACQCWHHF